MDYRFSLTARLVTLGVCCLVALMALLFALGVVVGERMAAAPAAGSVAVDTAPVATPAREAAQ